MESSGVMEKGKVGKMKVDSQRVVPFAILILMIIVLSIANENFLQLSTFRNLFQSVAATGIIAVGASFVLITGGIDFTTGYGLSTAAVSAGALYIASGRNALILVLVGISAGIIIGVINGLLVSRLNMPPFIATLAMMSVLHAGYGADYLRRSAHHDYGKVDAVHRPGRAVWLASGVFYNFSGGLSAGVYYPEPHTHGFICICYGRKLKRRRLCGSEHPLV